MKKIFFLFGLWAFLFGNAQISGSVQTGTNDWQILTEGQYTVIQLITPPRNSHNSSGAIA